MKEEQLLKSVAFLLISFFLPFVIGGYRHFSQTDVIYSFIAASILDFLFVYPSLRRYGMVFLFSPCFFSVIYISFNSIIGGVFMKNGWCLDRDFLSTFQAINAEVFFIYTLLTIFFNAILCVIACHHSKRLSSFVFKGKDIINGCITSFRIRRIVILFVILSLLAAIPAMTYHSERTTLNAILSLYFPVYLGVLATLFYNVLRCGLSNRVVFAIMMGLFVMSAVALFHSKREAFFCLILMIMMYSFERENISLKLKHFLLGGIVVILSIVLVLASSLMRGYNNFQGDSFIEAVKTIPQYAASPTFMSAIGGNFEVVGAYPHTVNAFNYINNGEIPTLYGETFWRVLFVPIPESLFGYKPRKMLAIYTEAYDPSFRDIGGSYPVMCYADFVANFRFISIIFVILFFGICERIYYSAFSSWRQEKKRVNNLTSIAFASIIILFTRGDGFSSLCLYTFLTWGTIMIIRSFNLV